MSWDKRQNRNSLRESARKARELRGFETSKTLQPDPNKEPVHASIPSPPGHGWCELCNEHHNGRLRKALCLALFTHKPRILDPLSRRTWIAEQIIKKSRETEDAMKKYRRLEAELVGG